jgi:hypothetical protein
MAPVPLRRTIRPVEGTVERVASNVRLNLTKVKRRTKIDPREDLFV